jgi:cholesterol transport system auxiliary component
MNAFSSARVLRCGAVALILALTCGCSMLFPKPKPQPGFFSLDATKAPAQVSTSAKTEPAPALVVYPPRAAAGFDSQRIIYLRQTHKLEYFAHSQWIDTPARMLAPLMVAALRDAGAFDAVLLSTGGVAGDMRLDTEILRLQQDFRSQPSAVRFTLRVNLVDSAGRKVLQSRDLDASVAAASDDPYAGVVAANQAVQEVLQQLAVLCSDAAQEYAQDKQAEAEQKRDL